MRVYREVGAIGKLTSSVILVCALAIRLAGAATPAPDAPKRPEWCPAGWICMPTQEVADATIKLIDLQEEVERLRLKTKRLSWHVTCGIGVAGVVTDRYTTKAVPGGFCGVGWGF